MLVLPSDVAAFLGRSGDSEIQTLAGAHLPVVTAMVRAYVRGVGFNEDTGPSDDLAAVIVSSCSRLVSNPSGTISESMGPFAIRQGIFNGWTLPELAILHTYRRRAA